MAQPTLNHSHIYLVLDLQRLDIPDTISVLISHTVHGKEAHAGHRCNRLGQPLFLIQEGFIDHLLRGDVGVKVIGDEVVISVLLDGVRERGEIIFVAEHIVLDSVKDALELRVQLEVAVEVSVAELFDILGEIAEEEDVLLADFAGDFDLWVELY